MSKKENIAYGIAAILFILGIVQMLSEAAHVFGLVPQKSYMNETAPWVSGALWMVLFSFGWREYASNAKQYRLWVVIVTSTIGVATMGLTLCVDVPYATKGAHAINALVWLVLAVISHKEMSTTAKQDLTP